MTKNPVTNTAAAVLYIVLVASFMTYAMRHGPEEGIIIPIAVLFLSLRSPPLLWGISSCPSHSGSTSMETSSTP